MIGPETYKQRTEAFAPWSYYAGSREKGETIRFLAPEGGGMLATIAENIPYKFISIKHLGMINQEGVEDTESEEVKARAGAFENYTFIGDNGTTTLQVDIDIEEKYDEMFQDMRPKALQTLKNMCESA